MTSGVREYVVITRGGASYAMGDDLALDILRRVYGKSISAIKTSDVEWSEENQTWEVTDRISCEVIHSDPDRGRAVGWEIKHYQSRLREEGVNYIDKLIQANTNVRKNCTIR